MKNGFRAILRQVTRAVVLVLIGSLVGVNSTWGAAQPGEAQPGPAIRITGNVSDSSRTRMRGTLHPLARAAADTGAVPTSTVLHGISMIFSRSDVQEADLKALMKAQQDPASPLYHQWLTPDQFAARFGMAQGDLDKAMQWLEQQGFSIDRVSRSRDRIYFSGTVGQVNSAFGTSLHYYTVDGTKHFAPSTELSLPSALAGVVLNIGNLDSFKPHAMHHAVKGIKPDFTSGISGSHFVSPGDVATIYDINAAYSSGWNGSDQGIAIVGQSDVYMSDIESFQTASGFASPKDPVKVLVPTTGNAGDYYEGDMAESDLDLEWSSVIAPGSAVYFVYTGDGGNAGVFDSLAYAIETRIAPVISVSYGQCEIAIGSPANVQSLDDIAQQGAVQGQTLLAASGDDGASSCFRDTELSNANRAALSTSYPASSAYFTGIGGTEFNEGSGNYWNSASGTDIIASAISYIPEVTWNEDSVNNGLGSSGGGASILFAKPDWQVGVPGIPSDGMRDVPDIALDSAGGHDGLLFCTSDSSYWAAGQVTSCSSGFRDSYTSDVTFAGGTSFAAPIFAGMIAILNQQQNSTGQGLLNQKLYTIASNPVSYASAFHDIVMGDNKCDTGETSYCPNGPTGYAAGVGYDQTTGLGTVDFNNLLTAWGTPTLSGSITSLTLITQNPTTAAPVEIGISVAPASGSAVPTGTVTMTVDGTTDATPVPLDGGAATYNASISGSGNHVVVATYSGDSTFAASTTTLLVNTLFETSTHIDVSPADPVLGATATFTAHVEPTAGLNFPDGTVTFAMDGIPVSYGLTLTNGTASYTGVMSQAGSHMVTATYSGSPTFASSIGSINIHEVTGTSISVIAASGTPMAGASDNIVVKVSALSGNAVPDGSLRVVVNGAPVAPAPVLDGTGSVTVPVVFSHVGTQTVAVSYPGSASFAPATGSASVSVMPAATVTTVVAGNAAPLIGAEDTFTATIASGTGGAVADGVVNFTVDGTAVPTAYPVVNGSAVYTTAFTSAGAHTVVATYSGSTESVSSSGNATVNVPAPAFTLASSGVTVPQKGSGVATITVTPADGYSGTITFKVTGSGMMNTCYSLPDLPVDGSGPVTANLKLTASSQTCPVSTLGSTAASVAPTRLRSQVFGGSSLAVAGLLLCCFAGRRRWQKWLVVLLVLSGLGVFATGCGGSSSNETKKGSYTLTVTGTDTKTSSIASTVTVNVTVE